MRILVLTNLYPPHAIGGYEQACRDNVEGLRQRGHHVDVLTSTYGVPRPAAQDGIHRQILPQFPWDPHRSPLRGKGALARWNWAANRTLRALLTATRPDIVYVWNMAGLPMSLLTTIRRAGLRMVFNLQDRWPWYELPADAWLQLWTRPSSSSGPPPLKTAIKALLAPAIDRLIPTRYVRLESDHAHFPSKAYAQLYADGGWHFASEHVIYNSIDIDLFTPTAAYVDRQPCRLLVSGQLVPHKGAHVAIQAVALLVRRLGKEAVTLTIVGSSRDTAYHQRLHQLVDDLDLGSLIVFRGAVPRSELPAIYADHDIFVFPSSWLESFGLVLAEAMACGLPVVGTAPGGSVEILQDGQTGLVVPQDDPEALARALERLLGDPHLAHRLAASGMTLVREQFDQRRLIQQVEDSLLEIAQA